LTDPQKKKIYDEYGEEGLEGGVPGQGGSSFDFNDLLSGMRQRGPRKAKSVLHLLEVSLADIYLGAKKIMKINRERNCKECAGKGGKEDSIIQCKTCGGAGRVAKLIRMGFMTTQTVTACDECKGRGKVIKDKCKVCKGKCVVEDVKVIEIDLEKGTPEGHRYTFAGEADEYVSLKTYLH